MFRYTLAVVALLWLGAVSPARADRGGYAIDRFHTELWVESNSDLVVEERLEVDFRKSRHGIYRAIPVRYTDRKGYGYSLGFRLMAVTDEHGNEHETKITNKGRYVEIRIGSPDRTVNGRVIYIIRYRVKDALVQFPEYDELYWNATGHEWNTTIRKASATIHLPSELISSDLQAAGYSGRLGATGANVAVRYPQPGVVTYEISDPLGPMQGLTVSVGWPQGHVSFPGTLTRVARFVGDNWIAVAPLFFFAWLWRRYRNRGKDPAGPASVVVRYDPPQGMTPGELGTIVDESVDLRDITAVVVDLAVRGYLVIQVEKQEILFGLTTRDEISFSRQKEKGEKDLLVHEQLVLNGIFESGDVVTAGDLKEEFYQHIPGIKDALYEHLTESGYFAGKPSSVRTRYVLGGILAALVTAGLGIAWAGYRGMFFPQAIVLPVVAALATLLLFIFFAPAMPRRTLAGVRMRAWAKGFEEFVDRVEKDRLDDAEARNAFETLLPFAMALGISSKWARRFEDIYREASPGWYVGPHFGHSFSTRAFEQSLSSSMGSVGKQMAASPRSSSGSGGGGSSGGGGGGGGGGSW